MSTTMTLQSTYSTVPGIAYAGLLEGSIHDAAIDTMLNADTVSIPFGCAVSLKASPTTEKDVVLPSTSTSSIFGIVLHDNAYARVWTDSSGTSHGDLDSTGLVVGTFMSVLRRGRVAVLCQSTTAVGDSLHASFGTGGTTYTAKGQLGGAAEASHSLKATGTTFVSAASATGFAWLECNFVGSTSTAD